MLILTGYVHLAPSDVEAFVADMAMLVTVARSRDGCLFFAIAPEDPAAGRMLVSERWRDQAALDVHIAAADTVAFVARWGRRMRSDLAQFDVSGQRASPALKT